MYEVVHKTTAWLKSRFKSSDGGLFCISEVLCGMSKLRPAVR